MKKKLRRYVGDRHFYKMLLAIVVPIIICIIISFIITYFPTSDVSLILASDFLPIAIKIQGVGILIAILVSIFKIKKD